MESTKPLQLVPPSVPPPLDPAFRPAILANRFFQERATESGAAPLTIAIEQADGSVFHHSTAIFPDSDPASRENFRYVERLIKFLLWSRGGFRVFLSGAPELGRQLRDHFGTSPTGCFDANIMGSRIYEHPFAVAVAPVLPAPKSTSQPLGRHLQGCRIGFDLGGSDRKVAAVMDGKCVFSEEDVWSPVTQTDPQWHFDQIQESLRKAAGQMPRVDAIGGSSAGVYVNNRVKVASLFRGVPPDLFEKRVKNLFLELKAAWGNIPFEVANDGEVTALAGSMALGKNAVLGLAMGTSMAAGYVTPDGNITTWLNELAFAPIDYNPDAPMDEWSGDRGCGVQYFSQQAVGRLLVPAGIDVDPALSLPEKLLFVQNRMKAGDERAVRIYETIGIYLCYGLAHYADFYDYENVLVLGRVTTGAGGDLILEKAREILKAEFPSLFQRVQFHVPDEKDKRHGQAIAAASLPA